MNKLVCSICNREVKKLIGNVCIECMAVKSYVESRHNEDIENMPLDTGGNSKVTISEMINLMEATKKISMAGISLEVLNSNNYATYEGEPGEESLLDTYIYGDIDTSSDDFKSLYDKYADRISEGGILFRSLDKFGTEYTGNILDISGNIAVVASDLQMENIERGSSVCREILDVQETMPERLYNIVIEAEMFNGLNEEELENLPELEDFVEA